MVIFIFAVEQDGETRQIFDLRYVNEAEEYRYFPLGTLKGLAKNAKPHEWWGKADLKSGWSHVKAAKWLQLHCAFMWNEAMYLMCALPFGLGSALYIFTKIWKPVRRLVVDKWQAHVKLLMYIVDLI